MNALDSLKRWFLGPGFPSAALALLLSVSLLIGIILVIPETDSLAGRFAREFRLYCFGADLKSGRFPWSEAILFFLDPLIMAGIVFYFWRRKLREVPFRRLVSTSVFVFILIFASGAALAYRAAGSAARPQEFPAQSLRTAFAAPDFALTDQNGVRVSVQEEKGKVLLITGFYTHCAGTCPAITGQLRRAAASIPESRKSEVVFLAVTMTPESDTVENLRRYSEVRNMPWPQFRLLTGAPDAVSRALDLTGVSRAKPDKNGQIDHANVILLVDRTGKTAYRFSIGELQEKWLIEALKILVEEPL